MIRTLQVIDASSLIGMVLCLIVIMQRDLRDRPFLVRVSTVVIGCAAYAQAMWLLGVYVPSASGFPWPRVTLDGALFAGCLVRVFIPVRVVV